MAMTGGQVRYKLAFTSVGGFDGEVKLRLRWSRCRLKQSQIGRHRISGCRLLNCLTVVFYGGLMR